MINKLRNRYKRCLGAIGEELHEWPLHITPRHDGSPHIEIEGSEYCFVVTERGEEFERIRTHNIDEVLFLLIRTVTFDLACDYELKHRIEAQDFRYILFDYEERLMKAISKDFFKRIYDYHESLLPHPYPVLEEVANKSL